MGYTTTEYIGIKIPDKNEQYKLSDMTEAFEKIDSAFGGVSTPEIDYSKIDVNIIAGIVSDSLNKEYYEYKNDVNNRLDNIKNEIVGDITNNAGTIEIKGTTISYGTQTPDVASSKSGDIFYCQNSDGEIISVLRFNGTEWTPIKYSELFIADNIVAKDIAAYELKGLVVNAGQLNVQDLAALKASIAGFQIKYDEKTKKGSIYFNPNDEKDDESALQGLAGAIYIGSDGLAIGDQLVYSSKSNKIQLGSSVEVSFDPGDIKLDGYVKEEDIDTKVAESLKDSSSATNTQVTKITKDSIATTKISASNITTGTLDAEKVEITNLTVKNANIESLNGEKLVNGSIPMTKLDVTTLNTVDINLCGKIFSTTNNTSTASKVTTDIDDDSYDVETATTLLLGVTNNYLQVGSAKDSKYDKTIVSGKTHAQLNVNGISRVVATSSSVHLKPSTSGMVYVKNNLGWRSLQAGKIFVKDPDDSTSSVANVRMSSSTGQLLNIKDGSLLKYKHDIQDLNLVDEINANKLYDVDVVSFVYNNDYLNPNDFRYNQNLPGLIVEDLLEKYPISVDNDEEGNPCTWNPRYLLPPMLKLIQEQKQLIDNLTARIEKLEQKETEI